MKDGWVIELGLDNYAWSVLDNVDQSLVKQFISVTLMNGKEGNVLFNNSLKTFYLWKEGRKCFYLMAH